MILGDLLFSVAKDTSPCVWYSDNGERIGTFDGHQGEFPRSTRKVTCTFDTIGLCRIASQPKTNGLRCSLGFGYQ